MKTLKKFYIIADTLNNTYLTNDLIFTDNIDDVNVMRFADISMAIARLTLYNRNIRYKVAKVTAYIEYDVEYFD